MSPGLLLPGAPPQQAANPLVIASPLNDFQILALVAAQQIHLSEDDAVERAVYLCAASLVAMRSQAVAQKALELQQEVAT